ncbi:MAG: DsrE family protein [Armatimonadetes bacterium]|nr:DsrE family protein [Armatimonadota bacterium]
MDIVLVVRTGPYAFQHLQTVIDVANSALDKGHTVGIFLAEDAVVAMNADCRTGGERNLTEELIALLERGVNIQGCGACCQFRGQKRSDLAEGLKMAGIATLGKMVASADRVLCFGY